MVYFCYTIVINLQREDMLVVRSVAWVYILVVIFLNFFDFIDISWWIVIAIVLILLSMEELGMRIEEEFIKMTKGIDRALEKKKDKKIKEKEEE